jgi:hypothetical protein
MQLQGSLGCALEHFVNEFWIVRSGVKGTAIVTDFDETAR